MTKLSNKLKKPCFWLILGPFSQFWGQKNFPENLSHTTSHGILVPCQNLEKINDITPRKHPDTSKDGRKGGQTLFYRTLPATARSSMKVYLIFGAQFGCPCRYTAMKIVRDTPLTSMKKYTFKCNGNGHTAATCPKRRKQIQSYQYQNNSKHEWRERCAHFYCYFWTSLEVHAEPSLTSKIERLQK